MTTNSPQRLTLVAGQTFIFISDAHLGSLLGDPELLRAFLQSNDSLVAVFCVVGDLFDFWKLSPIDFPLKDYAPSSTFVLLPGNHDPELGSLESSLRCEDPKFRIVKGAELIVEGAGSAPSTPSTPGIPRMLVSHGHQFDLLFGNPYRLLTRVKDYINYLLSIPFKKDLRYWLPGLPWLARQYFRLSNYRGKIQAAAAAYDCAVTITGHTHSGGTYHSDQCLSFDTGSWVTQPYALFVKGGKYAFYMVTKDRLRPAKEDFVDFRGH